MFYVLGKCMQMAAAELAEFHGKETGQIDAEILVPYLVYVVLLAVHQTASDIPGLEVDDMTNKSFKARLLIVEHFTVQDLGFGEGYYAFVTFKNVENLIQQVKIN